MKKTTGWKKQLLLAGTAFAGLGIFAPLLHAAEDSQLSISSGIDFTDGKYGDLIGTSILYVPLSLKYVTGPWTIRASTGYVTVDGPGNIIPGTEGSVVLTDRPFAPDGQSRKDGGISDVYVGLTYSLESLYDDFIFIDFTGQIKIPTANVDKGIGTGKMDYTFQFDVAKLIGDVMPFATLGYRVMGKSDLYELQNSFFASVGAAYYLTYDTSFGVSYDYRQSTSPNAKDPHEILLFVDTQITEKWGINFYGIAGLSESSPDWGLGLQVRMNLY